MTLSKHQKLPETPAFEDRLLTAAEVGAMIDSSRSELDLLIFCGFFPPPSQKSPRRWQESAVHNYMTAPTPRYRGRPLPARTAPVPAENI